MDEACSSCTGVAAEVKVGGLSRAFNTDTDGIGVALVMSPVAARWQAGSVMRRGELAANSLIVVNSSDAIGLSSDGVARVLALSIDAAVLHGISRRLFAGVSVDDALARVGSRVGISDRGLLGLMRSLRSAIEDPPALSRMKIGSIGHAVAAHVIGYQGAAPRSRWKAGGLDSASLLRVLRYIEAGIEGDLSDVVLAQQLDLPVTSFRRRFQASTGRTPHGHVSHIRLQRAVELLGCSAYSISDIAHMCGFSDHSHMCVSFKRNLGRTPGSFRKEP